MGTCLVPNNLATVSSTALPSSDSRNHISTSRLAVVLLGRNELSFRLTLSTL